MSYDDWKTADDTVLDDEECFECDCCSRLRPLTRTWTSCGIETFACDACRGIEEDE